MSEAECRNALERTDGQFNSALKYLKLKQLVNLKLGGIEQCKTALLNCQWNVQRAADFILDRKVAYENDVVGVWIRLMLYLYLYTYMSNIIYLQDQL